MSFAKRERESIEAVHQVIGTFTGSTMLGVLLADEVFCEDFDKHFGLLLHKQIITRDDLKQLQSDLNEALDGACQSPDLAADDKPLIGSYKAYAFANRQEMALLAKEICDAIHTHLSASRDRYASP